MEKSKLASAIAQHINETRFCYIPRRGQCVGPVTTWRERLEGYRWKSGDSAFSTWPLIARLEDELGEACRQIVDGEVWSEATVRNAIANTISLFCWGGVLRGSGHNPPSIKDIRAVMLTAGKQQNEFGAPLDSAWTKLAAVSTAKMKKPQVIYDSRVSVALLKAIDAACAQDPELVEERTTLKKRGLGYVTGRGGNRPKAVKALRDAHWKSGYGKWQSQFAASELINQIVVHLNDGSQYARMPLPDGSTGIWTVRGVEMVLFMDGY